MSSAMGSRLELPEYNAPSGSGTEAGLRWMPLCREGDKVRRQFRRRQHDREPAFIAFPVRGYRQFDAGAGKIVRPAGDRHHGAFPDMPFLPGAVVVERGV